MQRRELRKSVEKELWKRGLSPVPWNTFYLNTAPILLGGTSEKKKKNQWACFRRWGFWGKEEPSFFIFPHMVFGIPLSPRTFSCPLEKQCHSSLIQPQWDGKRMRVKRAHYTVLNILSCLEYHLETWNRGSLRDWFSLYYRTETGRQINIFIHLAVLYEPGVIKILLCLR